LTPYISSDYISDIIIREQIFFEGQFLTLRQEEKMPQWVRLPLDIVQEVSPVSAIVYAIMLDRIDDTGLCWIAQSQLVEMTSCTRNTVKKALSELEKKSYITVAAEPGTKRRTAYRVAQLLQPKKRSTAATADDLSAYKALVNRFDDELPGQQTL
jgi:DNA-binding MarR family transcriptional regulator